MRDAGRVVWALLPLCTLAFLLSSALKAGTECDEPGWEPQWGMFLRALPQEEAGAAAGCSWNGGGVGVVYAAEGEKVARVVRCSLVRPAMLLLECGWESRTADDRREVFSEFEASAAAHPALNYCALLDPPAGLCKAFGISPLASEILLLSSSGDSDGLPNAYLAGMPSISLLDTAREHCSSRLEDLATLMEPAYHPLGV
ncbi:hypothetical protein T484DRAFT_1893934, partial [Baffinella frigidus]